MITLEYDGNKIVKDKTHYELRDLTKAEGESDVAIINFNGVTRVQDKRVRKDGSLTYFGFRLLLTQSEREIVKNMSLGENKARKCRPVTLTISGEFDRNGIYRVRFYELEGFYEETSLFEDLDDVPEVDDIAYEIDVLFVKL